MSLTIRASRGGGKGRNRARETWSKAARIAATLRWSPRAVPGRLLFARHVEPESIEQEVRQFLRDNFPLSADGVVLSSDDSLIEVGVIDSTGVLELIGFIEERYEVTIADEEVLPENLDSIASITRFVGEKRAG